MSTVYKNNAEKKLLKQIDKFFDKAQNIVSKNGLSVEKHIDSHCENDQDIYAAIIFSIRR